MIDRERAERLLAERRRRREQEAQQATARAVCSKLREFFYPKQRAFYTSKAKRRATSKTRRAGATSGGCRELIARAVELAGFRATYVTTTRIEARERAWENDTQSGLVDILREYGTRLDGGGVDRYAIGGLIVEVRAQDLALEFSNGSRINLFGADDERAINKQRGLAKHVFWVDEAQDFRFLERFYKAVVVPALADFEGECWLSGTPGRDCAGFFYEVTRDDRPGLEGWEVHTIAVVDNPYFGKVVWEGGQWFVVDNKGEQIGPYATEAEAETAAVAIRWERTAGAAIRENGWAEDDPDLLREWFARWVKTDARFVYAANSVPLHKLTYAPQRLAPDGFPDVQAALRDLPGWDEKREYFLALGADLGTRDDFAFVLWAWSLKDAVLYEVCSWKRPGLDYDEMAAHLRAVREQVHIGIVVADAGGGGKPAVMGWSKKWVERYALPIIEATKTNKDVAIKQLNNDIRRGLVKLREGSPLLAEWLVHRWSPKRSATGRMVEDPSTPNHCSDGGLYAHRESYHHRFHEEALPVQHGTVEWLQREERELEEVADDPDAWSW